MSVSLYDEALSNKIEAWVGESHITILKPDETNRLFKQLADKNDDKPLTLPIIAISRDRDITILDTHKQSKTFIGANLQATKEMTMTMNVIPISISYQIDIYTHSIEEADVYIREFVFKLINSPRLKITLPYNGYNYEHYSTLYLNDTISDNSDIQEKHFPDEFTRITLKLVVDDAYLFSIPFNNNTQGIDTEYNIYDSPSKSIVESGDINSAKLID